MTPDQIEQAAELLCDRADIAERLERYGKAVRVRIAYATKEQQSEDDRFHFVDGPELTVTPTIRRLLCQAIEAELASIDQQLTTLGVDISGLQKGQAA